ncbi:MAG TPA: 16S rRNA (guanine(966)-N(2))-methyltransferase RsmD [Euzebyales bacterium]|nr:16S rRNA (guanine(966)-N(2))-methyltransferase RsmD [Euzebyales bacterium]
MRVVAGVYGGRRLRAPRGRQTRPTSDRVREALFSTLGAHVAGAHVVDLYAGSGALGIEALSRGAAGATFVERDRATAAVLRANLRDLGLEEGSTAVPAVTVHVGDALRFVEAGPPAAAPRVDIVLCDPPYKIASDELATLLTRLAQRRWLSEDARLVAERTRHGEALTFPEQELHVADVRTYGDTVLYYIRRGPAGARRGGGGRA